MRKDEIENFLESEFINRMSKAFDYFDCIKKITECDDKLILNALRNTIDRRLKEI